jgi:hypothetical protein
MIMDKRTGGLLVGAAAGIALAWHFLRRDQAEVDLQIGLEPADGGGCRVATKPEFAELHWMQKVNWHITNNCNQDVRVALESWRDRDGRPRPPAANSDDPNQPGLWKKVKKNDTATIKAKARLGFFEDCYYDVYLDDQLGADPIVKLTP